MKAIGSRTPKFFVGGHNGAEISAPFFCELRVLFDPAIDAMWEMG